MKKAFTMLELIFVIVVIGILTSVIIPRTQTNSLEQAANQVIEHIRYTQHLAMIDDKYDANSKDKFIWYRQRWEMAFSTANSSISYFIFSDSQSNANPDASNKNDIEVAKDPLNKNLYLIGTEYQSFYIDSSDRINKKLNLKTTYGINYIKVSGGSSSTSKRILFDYLGRPYQGTTKSTSSTLINSPQDKIMNNDMYIKLCIDKCIGIASKKSNNKEILIKIEKETGYSYIFK